MKLKSLTQSFFSENRPHIPFSTFVTSDPKDLKSAKSAGVLRVKSMSTTVAINMMFSTYRQARSLTVSAPMSKRYLAVVN